MKDLDIAKKVLEERNLALVIVKEGKVIFTSNDRGIKPLYAAVLDLKEELKSSSVADKVIGKAAAILCRYIDIKELYTKLISQEAIKILENSGIEFIYDESSPYIKNRDKTDMCPVEKLSQGIDNPEELLARIAEFLDGIEKRL